MSFLIIPVWPWGQINIKRADQSLFSERNGLVPTVLLAGIRFTWRRWRLLNEDQTMETEILCGDCKKPIEPRIRRAVAVERERCAKIADAHAARCERGSPVSSMAEDGWGAVAAREIAAVIRNASS